MQIMSESDRDTLVETNKGKIKILRFNKLRRKNAIDRNMYIKLTKALNDAATCNQVSMVVLTGTGDFYSSGNDLSAETALTGKLLDVIEELINAFIMFPKPLVAIVNGPAVGIAVTTLPLCDFVYAAENAYFYAPFTKLGVVPEGCSTFTFPNLIGYRKAMELLMLNKRMSAKDALKFGLVNNVWKSEELQTKAWKQIEEILKVPEDSFLIAKQLFRKPVLDTLIKTNKSEIEALRLFTKESKSKL